MPFHRVLDLTTAIVVEIYREFGMKFTEIMEELDKRLAEPDKRRTPPQPDNQASLAMLQAMMGDSDFKGVKG